MACGILALRNGPSRRGVRITARPDLGLERGSGEAFRFLEISSWLKNLIPRACL